MPATTRHSEQNDAKGTKGNELRPVGPSEHSLIHGSQGCALGGYRVEGLQPSFDFLGFPGFLGFLAWIGLFGFRLAGKGLIAVGSARRGLGVVDFFS